jgi:putative ABC transport system permease protein
VSWPYLKALLWLIVGRWREQPGRLLLSLFAVALGVALGLAIHLVNRSALSEFSDAIALVNGQAQRQVTVFTGAFNDAVFDSVVQLPGLSAASPVIEAAAEIAGVKLKLIGLDLFKAIHVTPELVIISDTLPKQEGDNLSAFQSDQVYLSTAALNNVKKQVGDKVTIAIGTVKQEFVIAGRLSQVPTGQVIATTDIGTLQWRFAKAGPEWLGKISRIDLKLDDAQDKQLTDTGLEKLLAAESKKQSVQLRVDTPQAATQRMSNVSRAYRVNLAVLGTVALVVGGFLVFSTMALMAQRQIADAAVLSLLGLSAARIQRFMLAQGLAIGVLGSLLGIGFGLLMAQSFLTLLGGDLGGGYFNGSAPRLNFSIFDLALFGLMGIGISVAAAWPAATQLVRSTQNPTTVLSGMYLMNQSGQTKTISFRSKALAIGLCLVGAIVCLALPPILDLPLGGFSAMGLLLIAGVAVVPWLTQGGANLLLNRFSKGLWKSPALWLGAQRLGRYPHTVSTALAGIVASVALASAMAIMVHSFRDSVDSWLSNILPADLYIRSSAKLQTAEQQTIRAMPGIARADFLRAMEITMRNDLPKVALVGRSFSSKNINEMLPLIGTSSVPSGAESSNVIQVYGSEAMVDLYGWKQGSTIASPIAGIGGPKWFIAGIWRDYGRQHGAIALSLEDFAKITGQASASDIAVWLAPGATSETVIQTIKTIPDLAQAEARSSEAIRAISLKIFDRSFALTYVIEAIAILVAIFGVASTYAGEALSRKREFGTLAHLGAKPALVAKQIAFEALLAITLAVAWGAIIGIGLAWILVRRINPQSFHWSMDFAFPVGLLLVSAASLIALGIASALLAYRTSLRASPVLAIKG